MKWILIVWMAAGYNGNTPSQVSVEFNSYETCQKAYKTYVAEINKSRNRPYAIKAVCVQKG